MKSWEAKDPDEIADYVNNWTLDSGDTLSSSNFVLTVAAGLTITQQSYSGNAATVWLSGGTDGHTAILTNTVTTQNGRTFEEVIALPIVSNYPPQTLTPGYIIPTPATLKTVFPAFEGVPDATVQFWIDLAATMVDNTWFETDYAMAIMLLACHYMVGAGLGTGAEAQMAAQGMAGFQTIRSGQLTLSRGTTSQSDSGMGEWGATVYGRQFYWLLRRNKPGGVAAVAALPPDIHPWWTGIFISQGRFP